MTVSGVKVVAGACLLLLTMGATHTVRPGETLSGIAHRNGVRVTALAAANGLADPDLVVAGMRLVVPDGSGSGSGAARTVQRGDTLWGIARAAGVSVRALAAANGLAEGALLRPGQRLVVPAGGASRSVGERRPEIGALLAATARRYGWRPAFVQALAWQESGWNPRAVSPDGARGVMQVMPSTGEFISRRLLGRPLNLDDPADNIEAGVAFLDHLHDLTGGDVRRTLAGYYQGLRSLRINGPYLDTVRYVDNVLALRARFTR
jgi:soluble lytic murein transglycosylase-like protein